MSEATVETTVTFLKMSAPPARFPPMPSAPRLALMKVENIPLHFYRYLYDSVGGDWLWVERLGLDDAALTRAVRRESIQVTVLYADGAPGGFYELDFARPGSVNLSYFGLMPEWTGRRIGPWMLGCAIRDGFAHSAREMTLNTCTFDHPAALPLYQKLGFEPVRQEPRKLAVPPGMTIPGHNNARITR